MGMFEHIGTASDRVIQRLVAGLEIEFGRGAGAALAERFLEAEELDFTWDARLEERWLSAYENGGGESDFELDRIACLGRLDGRWFMAVMLVDGEGQAQGMLAQRHFRSRMLAHKALIDAR